MHANVRVELAGAAVLRRQKSSHKRQSHNVFETLQRRDAYGLEDCRTILSCYVVATLVSAIESLAENIHLAWA